MTVKPAAARVLQGNTIQATIEARYFFGEPVAGAKVTYVVHTSQHYWWDEDEEDENGDSADAASADTDDEDDTDSGYGETEQQEHQGVLDANGQLTVTLPTAVDGKHNDQDYRIEARVTDAANREVSGHSTVLATYGSFRVSVEPTSYVVEAGKPARVKVTAQDYDGKPVQTQVHIAARAEVGFNDSPAERRRLWPARIPRPAPMERCWWICRWAEAGILRSTASAQTPENRTVQGQTWVWIWNGAGAWYQANAQAQIVADKKSYQVGDTAHLLLVTGLR